MFKKVSGTKDILPKESGIWQEIEEISRRVFSLYNFKEIRSPLIEEAALFNRSLGEGTEIVQKQMFLMQNKNELYALRPEGTASIVRAYIENNFDKTSPFSKFYYIGPMFRLERPQKGRLRQFNHIGCEAIGSYEPELDIEIISLADSLLDSLSITGYKIKLNSLGCLKDKNELTESLRRNLEAKATELCDDCKERIKNNPLRVLDCKNDSCRQIVKNLNLKTAYLCDDCKAHFDKVRTGLDSLNIKYELAPYLVRGLDYYTGTVFEITHKDLGAQDAIGAGGRYNNLVKELGGPSLGAIGFAFGVERLLLVSNVRCQVPSKNLVYIITLGDKAKSAGLGILNELRYKGVPADTDYEGKSIKGALRKANDMNARFALIIGDNEIKKDAVTLKDMISGEQKEVRIKDLTKELNPVRNTKFPKGGSKISNGVNPVRNTKFPN
ncbi:MAG: histidine--tRNA ligase, partial [Candidatus Omnitrophica bacterium CG08_land_8_20_14_0_20_41_16]